MKWVIPALGAALMLLSMSPAARAAGPATRDWVGFWQQGDKLIVISAPQDGAADVIHIKAYPDGPKRQGGDKARTVTMRAYDTDLEHPRRTDADGGAELQVAMRLSGRELRVEHQRTANADIGDLTGRYHRSTHPLAMLWAERPAWLRFHCDCDGEAIEQSVLSQLASGTAVGRGQAADDSEHLVMVVLDAATPTVLVLTHSSDSECSQDSFRIVSKGEDGRWLGDVARWLGWPRRPGGIQDQELWQLSPAQRQSLAQLQDGDLQAVPRFRWRQATKTLEVGMEACAVLPEGATPRTMANARKLGDLAAAFVPRVYTLKPPVTAR